MSDQINEQPAQYFGVLNGVMYRIDTNMGGSERLFGLVPLEMPPAATAECFETGKKIPSSASNTEATSPAVDPSLEDGPEHLTGAEPIGDEAQAEEKQKITTLFNRDGAEPLRAGHPDLWNLLVAGTCLEGSTFKST